MKTKLSDIAKIHFALTLETEENTLPILWLYEHFLREALEFPFRNPVQEFWGEGGASTETMVNALSAGEPYAYFVDSMYAEYYCRGLASSVEWGMIAVPLVKLTTCFVDITEGDTDEMLIDNMVDEFTNIILKLCSQQTLEEATEMANDM